LKHFFKHLLLELLLVVAGGLHEADHDVNRNRDNGAIVLSRYSTQRFKISQQNGVIFKAIVKELNGSPK
jgi:hypothetical protein